jgi:HEAT repeat protein
MVRRTAIDAAADTEDPAARGLFELALRSDDPWIRWKAVHALGDIGLGESRAAVATLSEDEDFQVRLEVAGVLRV